MHLKFEINAYDPVIVQQLVLSGEQSSGVDSRRPTIAWIEDSSSCSDIPKLEGDRYAKICLFLALVMQKGNAVQSLLLVCSIHRSFYKNAHYQKSQHK